MAKNQTVHFHSNFLLPPLICTQTGNHSLRGVRVNPAGCGKSLHRTAEGWQTRALKLRQSTEWLHRLPGTQHIREANERRLGKTGRVECNTTRETSWWFLWGRDWCLHSSSHIKHVVRSEWPGAEQQARRNYCIWATALGWLMRKCAICSIDVDY